MVAQVKRRIHLQCYEQNFSQRPANLEIRIKARVETCFEYKSSLLEVSVEECKEEWTFYK